MFKGIRNILNRLLLHRAAYVFMTAPGDALAAEPPERFSRACLGVMALSLGWGLLLCGVWGASYWLFFELVPPSVQFLPAIAAMAVFCLWPYRRRWGRWRRSWRRGRRRTGRWCCRC